jgi:hypothetical protein
VRTTPKLYYTQYSETVSGLDELVNERLAEGWQLYGPPYSITPADPEKDPLFCQAMTRPKTAQTISQHLQDEPT